MGTELAVPTTRDAALALDSPTLYVLEQAGEIAREILDGRIVAWTSQGWSQRKIAGEIGCSQQAIGKRQARLGIEPAQPHRRSDNQVVTSENGSESEVIDAEIVDDEPARPAKPVRPAWLADYDRAIAGLDAALAYARTVRGCDFPVALIERAYTLMQIINRAD